MGAFKNAVQNYVFFLIRTNIFSSFVHALIETDMKRHVNNLGIYAVCLGVLLLLTAFLAGWTDSNLLLVAAWLLIVGGIIGHVVLAKRQSKY